MMHRFAEEQRTASFLAVRSIVTIIDAEHRKVNLPDIEIP